MKGEFPVITTERLFLRQFKATDLQNLYKGLSHPDIIKHYGIRFDSLEATEEQLEWFSELERTGLGLWWAVSSKDSGDFYGAAGLYFIKEEHRKAETGFWLLPEYWGKGIIKEAMQHICKYGYSQLNLHRIEAYVESENINSKSLLQKIDFEHEGTMRDCEFKDGRFISLDIYAKLKVRNELQSEEQV